jgi:exosortase family protein XrtM
MLIVFVIVAGGLQALWSSARGSPIERLVIEQATVNTSVALINWFTPDVAAHGDGSRIRAPGGGINILNGCEGTEVLFILFAAMLAYPSSWRMKALGLLTGTAAVFALNQVRLLVLFYGLRFDRDLFSSLHGLVTPLVLVLCTVLFFIGWMAWAQRGERRAHGPAPQPASA